MSLSPLSLIGSRRATELFLPTQHSTAGDCTHSHTHSHTSPYPFSSYLPPLSYSNLHSKKKSIFFPQQHCKKPKTSDWNSSKEFLQAERQKCTQRQELRGNEKMFGKGKLTLKNVVITLRKCKILKWRGENSEFTFKTFFGSIPRSHSFKGCFPLWGNEKFKCCRLSLQSRNVSKCLYQSYLSQNT